MLDATKFEGGCLEPCTDPPLLPEYVPGRETIERDVLLGFLFGSFLFPFPRTNSEGDHVFLHILFFGIPRLP